MKLRNKKTGEHGDYKVISAGNFIRVRDSASDKSWQYDCLKRLNEEWEDAKEPLIKDEKIRKAVRAWAEANGASRVYIVDLGMLRDESSGNEIKFNGEPFVGWVTSLKTITELCGDEIECSDS